MPIKESNQQQTKWSYFHRTAVDYFPLTGCPVAFYSSDIATNSTINPNPIAFNAVKCPLNKARSTKPQLLPKLLS